MAGQITLNENAIATEATKLQFSTTNTGTTQKGSRTITGMSSTAGHAAGWAVTGSGIPVSATITSVDSTSQIQISETAETGGSEVALSFGIQYRPPTCFGDDPTILLPTGKILAGNLQTAES
jgi:hypothetical protein